MIILDQLIRPQTARFLLLPILAAGAAPLSAQDLNSISSTIDEIRDRRQLTVPDRPAVRADTLFADVPGPPPPRDLFKFDLTGSTSLTYDSNPARADGGSADAARFRQLLAGTLTVNLEPVVITAEAGLVHDDYSDNTVNDLTLVPITVRAVHGNQDTGLAPYVAYAPTLVFGDFLSAHRATVHDFSGGITRRFDLDGNPLSVNRFVAIDLAYARRHATLPGLEEHRPFLKLTYFERADDNLLLTVSSKVTRRIFTAGANDGRDDWNLEAVAGLEWRPRPEARLSLSVRFERNASDRLNSDYSAWNIGPAFTAAFSF